MALVTRATFGTLLVASVLGVRIRRKNRKNQNGAKLFGVNYGNRFVPEKWMWPEEPFMWNGVTAQGREPGDSHTRLSLPDLGVERFTARMPRWLDLMVQESDFQDMQRRGVNVIRLPTGYWNWVSYPGDSAPNAPANESARMKVLTSLPPSAYRTYFDRIFSWAGRYGIKVLLDLHGVPGSANGMETGGICVEQPYWDTDWNIQKSVEAVGEMAKYGVNWGPVLYGLQVINEPLHFGYDIRDTLDRYYHSAILEARRYLPFSVPVIVYEWHYNFKNWPSNRFDGSEYGLVVWDTHIYTGTVWDPPRNVEEAQTEYRYMFNDLLEFHNRQAGGTIVGEWALAGTEFADAYPERWRFEQAYQDLASWVVWCLMERSHGIMFWNWETTRSQWSYKGAMDELRVDWVNIPKPSHTLPSGGCCKFGGACADCGDDGTGWCHQSASNCAVCTGTFDSSASAPSC